MKNIGTIQPLFYISDDNKDKDDFLKSYTLLMKDFEDDNGYHRKYHEGAKKGIKLFVLFQN